MIIIGKPSLVMIIIGKLNSHWKTCFDSWEAWRRSTELFKLVPGWEIRLQSRGNIPTGRSLIVVNLKQSHRYLTPILPTCRNSKYFSIKRGTVVKILVLKSLLRSFEFIRSAKGFKQENILKTRPVHMQKTLRHQMWIVLKDWPVKQACCCLQPK